MVRLFGKLLGAADKAAASPVDVVASSKVAQVANASPTPQEAPQPIEKYLAQVARQSRALTPRGEAAVVNHIQRFGLAGQAGPVGNARTDAAKVAARHQAEDALDVRAAELLRVPLVPRRPLTEFAGELYWNAATHKARQDAVVQMREFCSQMSLTLVSSGDECTWCQANEGKLFSVQEDPNELLDRFCRCAPFPTATFHPYLPSVSHA